MTTYSRFALTLLAASGLVLAQDQAPANPQQNVPVPTGGGWRHMGNAAPGTTAAQAPVAQSQDPSEPVDRSDGFGQPVQQQDQQAAPPQGMPRNDRPPQAGNRPAYGLPAEVTVKPGTYVTVRTNQPLSTDHNQPGDTFSATLSQPLVADGIVVAQRGQTVYGRVAEVQKQHSDKSSRLGLELTGITLADGTQMPVRSELVARQGSTTPTGAQVGTVAGTTAVGAVVGAAADRGAGAAIGAGVGAVAGVAGVLLTRNHPTIVYPETPLTFQIDAPLTVATGHAPQAFRYVSPDDYQRGYSTEMRPRPAGPPAGYGPGSYGPGSYGPGYGPGYYPYYPGYWGPGLSIGFGPGFYYGRGYYRRWR